MTKPVPDRGERPVLRRRAGPGDHGDIVIASGPGRVLRPARQHRAGVGPRDGAPGPGAAHERHHAPGPHGQARTDERPTGLRAGPGDRGGPPRPAPGTGQGDRGAGEPQRTPGRAGHPPGHPQGQRPAAARSRDPGRGHPRARGADRRRQGGPPGLPGQAHPEWRCE